MNLKTTESNPTKRRKNRYTGLFLGWVVLSVVWIGYGPELCLPSYRANSNEIVNYSELIQRHTWSIVNNSPLLPLAVALLVGGVLVYRARRWWLSVLLIPVVLFACAFFMAGVLCDETVLYHVATAKLGDNVYHLTVGDYNNLDLFEEYLFIFQCDANDERCQGKPIDIAMWYEFENAKLIVDASHNQLQVINRDEVIYTLDPE
ncbi:MAG: hypothetical protein H6671_17090 [Anaerolineaceae bacterium]|nr:hypothetical protein [Anaerolineaceae bacterium]